MSWQLSVAVAVAVAGLLLLLLALALLWPRRKRPPQPAPAVLWQANRPQEFHLHMNGPLTPEQHAQIAAMRENAVQAYNPGIYRREP